jgi:MFS family permease
MSLNQSLYFMSLVGGMAGLFAWAVAGLVTSLAAAQETSWLSDVISALVLGGFIGAFAVAFSDRWSGNRVRPRWIVSGALIGTCAGLLAGLIQIPLTRRLADNYALLSRLITWMIAGSLIGLGLGMRWVSVNRLRAAHALVGGLIGGAAGGAIFAGLGGSVPDLSLALGFALTGMGISFGITFAPILLRDGLVQFVSSGDPRAQSKYGRSRKQWEVQDGDSYVIGSESPDASITRYRPEIGVFIPDASMAPRHARLYGRDGRFFVARHPDVANPAGLARYPLRVRGRTVTGFQELHDSDDILIGRTALCFLARHRSRS